MNDALLLTRRVWLVLQAVAAASMVYASWRYSVASVIVFAALYLEAGAQGRRLANWHREDQRSRPEVSR